MDLMWPMDPRLLAHLPARKRDDLNIEPFPNGQGSMLLCRRFWVVDGYMVGIHDLSIFIDDLL